MKDADRNMLARIPLKHALALYDFFHAGRLDPLDYPPPHGPALAFLRDYLVDRFEPELVKCKICGRDMFRPKSGVRGKILKKYCSKGCKAEKHRRTVRKLYWTRANARARALNRYYENKKKGGQSSCPKTEPKSPGGSPTRPSSGSVRSGK